jgi:SAM-dependent methyltransferase
VVDPSGPFLDLRPRAEFAEQTRYLDEALHADARHETVAPPLLGSKVRLDMLKRFLDLGPRDRVLDLGCGSGRTLAWNRDSGASLTGIDISPHFAPAAAAGFDLLLGDLRRLPIASGSFTKAWSLDVLEHVSAGAFRDVLKEAHRVLDRDGRLFIYTHVRTNGPLGGAVRLINGFAHTLERAGLLDLKQERLRKSDHLNPIGDHDELQRVVRECGFTIDRITYYTPIAGAFVENILVRVAEKWLVRRAAARPGGTGGASAARDVRRAAQARLSQRGATYVALRTLTALMKLDVFLFGRFTSGPFFALLRKATPADPAGTV